MIPKKIDEKLQFWETEAKMLKAKLPADDKVLSSWWNLIQSFKSIMKWVSKLVSDSLKAEHFEDIFSSIGAVYEKDKSYSVQDLIDLKLDDFVELINATFKKANNELANIQQFNQIKELWNKKIKYKLAKYYPDRQTKNGEEPFQAITKFNFILIDINEIRYLVEVD